MSKNEKLTAKTSETSLVISVTEVMESQLATPQDSNPLEKESEKVFVRETECTEIKTDDVEKGKDTNKNIEATQNKTYGSKELWAVACACAMFAVSAGVIGLFGMRGNNVVADTYSENDSSVTVTTAVKSNSDFAGTISWWKAEVEEYDLIQDEDDIQESFNALATQTTTTATTTTTTTSQTTTTTKPQTTTTVTTTKEPELLEEKIDAKAMYATLELNVRSKPDADASKVTIIKKGAEVKAVAKVSNGWYKVEVNGKTGYANGKYLTTEKPKQEVVTTPPETEKVDSIISDKTVIKYTQEELEMFYWVVEGEVGGCSEASKIAVANVIINRVKSPKFSNSLKGVMTAKNQFTAIKNYYNKRRKPTQSTIDCVNRALNGEDNTNGAIYFYSKKYCSASTARWFESLNFCFEIDGQRYFKPW